MKIFNINSIVNLLVITLVLTVFGLTGPIVAFAATTPSLGSAATYGVLSSTYTDTSAATTITGDVGFTTPPASAIAGVHTNYGSGAPYATAGVNQGSALAALALQPCTFDFASGAINLSTDTTHGTAGVYTPGVYCSTGAMDIGGPLTLNGSGTYIFRPVGALTSTAGSVVTLTGASACDVFWTPSEAATLAATTTFAGTIIDAAGITVGANTIWTGRALAFGGTVTTDTNTITVPTCTPPRPSGGGTHPFTATITVVKTVINDNGGTKTIEDFPLFINDSPVVSGVANNFSFYSTPALYAATETADSHYAKSFSGDCDTSGIMYLQPGSNLFCVITNNDIGAPVVVPPVPPLIDVIKVPSPLALPDGPGLVNYAYTLRNIGTVPVTNITMVGDTCSPIILFSGDTNGDSRLEVNETWVYHCSTTLTKTHTNTVVATGWANGISAVDIASATVVVGAPVVPPLIHVTKVPNPLTLLSGGGVVTYTKKVTNPGMVALNNVRLIDDKCAPLKYIFGDSNNDSKLDTTETWTYTCQTNLTKTITNTATVSGEANGLTARDFAIATVVVAPTVVMASTVGAVPVVVVPKLPRAGYNYEAKNISSNIVIFSVIFLAISASMVVLLKKRSE